MELIEHEYHKIDTIWKRNEKSKKIIEGDWSRDYFEFLSRNEWHFTEKVDGTNIRIHWTGEKVLFGGRTNAAIIPKNLLAKLEELFVPEKFINFGNRPVTLYGEGYGEKIQAHVGKLYNPKEVDFVLFDVFCGMFLTRQNVFDVAKTMNIKAVPVIGKGTLFNAIDMVQNENFKSTWGDFVAEGLVCRPSIELKNGRGERVITKIKVKDYKEFHNVATETQTDG